MNIEEIAERNPEAIIKIPVDINEGFSLEKGKAAAETLGIPAKRFLFFSTFRTFFAPQCVRNMSGALCLRG